MRLGATVAVPLISFMDVDIFKVLALKVSDKFRKAEKSVSVTLCACFYEVYKVEVLFLENVV